MAEELRGVLPIVHVPFTNGDEIDWPILEREIDWGFSQGIHGCGTGMVSELLRLTFHERNELTRKLVEFAAQRGPVFAGVGAESTRQAIEFARVAEEAGCDAIMATPPMTTALPATELLMYFSALASQISLPLIVQDASGYVGQPIPMEVSLGLLDVFGPNKILFKPEASPVGPLLSRLRDASRKQAKIYEGSGGIHLVDNYRRGIAGTMPGMEIIDAIVALWNALEAGDENRTYELSFAVSAYISLQLQAGLDGFLAIEKQILVQRGLFPTNRRRHPYSWEMDSETKAEVERVFERLQRVLGP